MHVAELWRHPVKSFQGEQLESTEIDADGLRFDRGFGVVDLVSDKILTARREPKLLFARASIAPGGQLFLAIPAEDPTAADREFIGPARDLDRTLSSWLGHEVALVSSKDRPTVSAENFDDPLDESSPVHEWQLPTGRFVDSAPLLLITTATLQSGAGIYPEGRWDVRRFRPNIVLDTPGTSWLEDSWRALTLRIGPVELAVRKPCSRCIMVTRPQPGLLADSTIFRSLAHEHGATFGVLCDVRLPGTVRVGDKVEVVG